MVSRPIGLPQTAGLGDLEGLLNSIAAQCRSSISSAAITFGQAAASRGLRVSVLHDLSCAVVMRDENGCALHESAFSWEGSDFGLWSNHESALRSQIIRACRVEGEPFWANRSGFHTRGRNPLLDDICLEDFEQRCRAKAALVVPVYAPFGQISAVVFTDTDPGCADLSVSYRLNAEFLSALSRQFLSGYICATRTARYSPRPGLLTDREVECLRWAAFGKTDHEIAMILARTHGTVRHHLKGICAKLGALNRAQAVFKAAQLGYLSAVE